MPNRIKHDRLKRQFISALYNRGRHGRCYMGTFTLKTISELTCVPYNSVVKIVRGVF